jgi:hypothetical protein
MTTYDVCEAFRTGLWEEYEKVWRGGLEKPQTAVNKASWVILVGTHLPGNCDPPDLCLLSS